MKTQARDIVIDTRDWYDCAAVLRKLAANGADSQRRCYARDYRRVYWLGAEEYVDVVRLLFPAHAVGLER
jgi:hypothetical protein